MFSQTLRIIITIDIINSKRTQASLILAKLGELVISIIIFYYREISTKNVRLKVVVRDETE